MVTSMCFASGHTLCDCALSVNSFYNYMIILYYQRVNIYPFGGGDGGQLLRGEEDRCSIVDQSALKQSDIIQNSKITCCL